MLLFHVLAWTRLLAAAIALFSASPIMLLLLAEVSIFSLGMLRLLRLLDALRLLLPLLLLLPYVVHFTSIRSTS